jgi:hypothetical protein
MINGGRFTVPQQTLIIKNNFFYSKTVSDVTSETVLIKKNIFKYKVTGRGRLCCPCLSLLHIYIFVVKIGKHINYFTYFFKKNLRKIIESHAYPNHEGLKLGVIMWMSRLKVGQLLAFV